MHRHQITTYIIMYSGYFIKRCAYLKDYNLPMWQFVCYKSPLKPFQTLRVLLRHVFSNEDKLGELTLSWINPVLVPPERHFFLIPS